MTVAIVAIILGAVLIRNGSLFGMIVTWSSAARRECDDPRLPSRRVGQEGLERREASQLLSSIGHPAHLTCNATCVATLTKHAGEYLAARVEGNTAIITTSIGNPSLVDPDKTYLLASLSQVWRLQYARAQNKQPDEVCARIILESHGNEIGSRYCCLTSF
ncbi:MAG TPA: hypothetical protein VN934_09915 [Candidatus Tumulicola sp.]|nr:hypothetical protein [Candidatus Tumulicola sp.]